MRKIKLTEESKNNILEIFLREVLTAMDSLRVLLMRSLRMLRRIRTQQYLTTQRDLMGRILMRTISL